MNNKRRIEIFSAGCSVCDETIALVKQIACPSCDVEILDMRETEAAEKAKQYGIQSVPAVVVDGKLADCCAGRGVDLDSLRNAGVGVPLM
ncbi:MAG: thioredoxin family protein [Acidobacteria bacterium]|nr:thioredoxin family protein [Acidobacteriota bacterium]